MSISSQITPPSGVYRNTNLQEVHWGPGCLSIVLEDSIKKLGKSKALILTGKTLATKTDVITKVQRALGSAYGATFHEIGEHAPVSQIRKAIEMIQKVKADVIVAVGGGSPIDSAKAICYFMHEQDKGNDHPDSFIPSIAIPTTLSLAETTQVAGFTNEERQKVAVVHPALVPRIVIHDAELTLLTPERLWLSTGIRALDHAIEFLYRFDTHPLLRHQALGSIRELFTFLPISMKNPNDINVRQRLQLAAFTSLWPECRTGALGLSHSFGHKLGATYGIPHGITSCLMLAKVVQYTAQSKNTPIEQLSALADTLSFIPHPYNSSPSPLGPAVGSSNQLDIVKLRKDGELVGQAIEKLVSDLGLHSTLKSEGVTHDQLDVIASRMTGEDKKGTEQWNDFKNILESVYDQ